MNPNKPIEEQDLEALLKVHFLTEISEEDGLAIAQAVFEQEYAVTIDPAKEKELLKKLGGPSKGGIKWGMLFGLFWVVVLMIWVLLIGWPTGNADGKIQDDVPVVAPSNTGQSPIQEPNENDPIGTEQQGGDQQAVLADDTTSITITLNPEQDLNALLQPSVTVDQTTRTPPIQSSNPPADPPTAPTALFSQAELAYYGQLTTSMIEQLIAYHDDLYTEVDAGMVNYKKKRLSVEGFVMRNTSVTNMEYKVFLTDLMAKGNTKGLEVALVNRDGWMAYQCDGLGAAYFSDHRYDGFPVVNISPDAMRLFCKWLEQEVNAYRLASNAKSKPVKIRLPYTYEWIHSAYNGFANVADCPGYYTIFSLSEGYVNKAFVKRMEKDRKSDRKQKALLDTLLSVNRYGMDESEILQIFETVIPDFNSDREFQEYPDGLLDIGKAAHVSELNQDETGELSVIVGCWESKEEYSGMLREFNALSGSPFVGFRFVIDDGRPRNYIDPLWR